MSILIQPFGSEGDVNPFLWLGSQLASRGHKISFLINPVYAQRAEARGFRSLGGGTVEQFEMLSRDPRIWEYRLGPKMFLGAMRFSFADLSGALESGKERFDLVIASTLGTAAASFAEAQGIPCLRVHLQPGFASYLPGGFLYLRMLRFLSTENPAKVRRILSLLDRSIFGRALGVLNTLRSTVGLGPVASMVRRGMCGGNAVALLSPRWIETDHEVLPPEVPRFGYPMEEGVTPLDAEMSAFLDAGEPPLVWTYGSMNFATGSFLKCAVETTARSGFRSVVIAPEPPKENPLPAGQFLHTRRASFNALFPRSKALIYHGGDGTSAVAARAGIPLILSPASYNQPDNARRFRSLGVGTIIPRAHFCSERVQLALDGFLQDPATIAACRRVAMLASQPTDWDGLCRLAEKTAASARPVCA